jgi:hypothetical protein
MCKFLIFSSNWLVASTVHTHIAVAGPRSLPAGAPPFTPSPLIEDAVAVVSIKVREHFVRVENRIGNLGRNQRRNRAEQMNLRGM